MGPIAVHAIDATGHVVGGVQFEPRVTARRPVTAEAAAGAAAAAAAAAARAEAETLLREALATQRARRAAIQARGFTLEAATRDRTARGDEHTERGLAALSDLLLEGGEWAEVR